METKDSKNDKIESNWEYAEKASKEVAEWPEWKQNIQVGYSYNMSSDPCLSHGKTEVKKTNK